MVIAWGTKVSPEFRARILDICKTFDWPNTHASWLMACIHFESGGTFSPSIKNMAGSGATGLIQFMPKTAVGLGTTTRALAAMTAVEQLDWVEKYFKPYAKRVKSLPDMYMSILLPSAIGKDDNAPLFSSGIAYRQNASLDANKDGVVTKKEASQRVQASLDKGLQQGNVFKEEVKPVLGLSATILQTAIPSLLGNLPELLNIFKNPDVSTRNVEAVSKVSEILMQSTGATNVQEAIERVQADPQTAVEANDALRVSRADIMDMMERVNAMDQANIKSARDFNVLEKGLLGKWKFVHLLSTLVLCFTGAFAWDKFDQLDPQMQSMVMTAIIIGGFTAVIAYWIGSSSGSDRKTDMINKV